MKAWKIIAGGCLAFLSLGASGALGIVVDFEDLALSPGSFYNGSDGAGMFMSRGATFNNTFTDFGGGFTAWDGFAYSNLGDTTTAGFGNQYSSFAGGGFGGGNFGVGFVGGSTPTITLPDGLHQPLSIRLTNSTYPAISMRDGDAFAKQFGGAGGSDPDFFRLTISAFDGSGSNVGSVEFFLADYRFADSAQDYIVDTWDLVDLSSLGAGVRSLQFTLDSTDNGVFGMNTPGYFAMDDLEVVPEPASVLLLALGAGIVAFRRRRH